MRLVDSIRRSQQVVRSPLLTMQNLQQSVRERRGFTLIKLLAVIAIITVVFGLAGVVFHRLFMSEQTAVQAALIERTISQLSVQFRRDAHAASVATRRTSEDGATTFLDLQRSTNERIVVAYSARDGRATREEIMDGKTSNRETYRLPDCQIQLTAPDEGADPPTVTLVIQRSGSTVTPQPHAKRPRRALSIEATLGSDARLVADIAANAAASTKEGAK